MGGAANQGSTVNQQETRTAPFAADDPRPLLPVAGSGDRAVLDAVRRFFVGKGPGAAVPEDWYPALLSAFRDVSRVRTLYPLFLPAPAGADTGACRGLGELLEQALPQGDVRILADNLPRLERRVRAAMAGSTRPAAAREVVESVREAFLGEIDLREEHRAELSAHLDALVAAIPAGQILADGPHADLHLLLHAVAIDRAPRLVAFRELVTLRVNQLRERLDADAAKRPRPAEEWVGALGGSGGLFDSRAMTALLNRERPTNLMSDAHRARLDGLVASLRGWLSGAADGVTVVHDGLVDDTWVQDLPVSLVRADDALGAGLAAFDERAAAFAGVVRALRAADLELDGTWDDATHTTWFEGFDWQSFSEDELHLLPVVGVLASASAVAANLASLTQLLLSGRPVQAMVVVAPSESPGQADPYAAFRLELGILGVGLRQGYVQQSSAARPQHLVSGLLAALGGTRAGLHVLSTDRQSDGTGARLGAWLHAGTALEGRAHPFFRFDPEQGQGFANRVDFSENASPDLDWPAYVLAARDAVGSTQDLDLPYTFADFALLERLFADQLMPVPDDAPTGDLVTVTEWLDLAPAESIQRVPTVWVVDADNALHRVAVSRKLAFVVRDRLAQWKALQEMAGINDEYARVAAEAARAEAREEADAELAQLANAHAAELDEVRAVEADEAMRRLTAVLLEGDLAGLTPSAPRPAAAPVAEAAPAGEAPVADEAPAEVEEEEEDALSFDEAYIDSFMCTSCNECTSANGAIFQYNADKQAFIADPAGGPFRDIVGAAEKCPARCIHPGKPLNPDEPGLDDLIARAAPFN